MKITDIKAFPVAAGGNQLFVKVETDEGIYGGGVCTCQPCAEGGQTFPPTARWIDY